MRQHVTHDGITTTTLGSHRRAAVQAATKGRAEDVISTSRLTRCLSVQLSKLRGEVAQFATIRDTLSFSADLLRDVTAQHIYSEYVAEHPGSGPGGRKYQKNGRAASGAADGELLGCQKLYENPPARRTVSLRDYPRGHSRGACSP